MLAFELLEGRHLGYLVLVATPAVMLLLIFAFTWQDRWRNLREFLSPLLGWPTKRNTPHKLLESDEADDTPTERKRRRLSFSIRRRRTRIEKW